MSWKQKSPPGRVSSFIMNFDPAVQRYNDLKMNNEIDDGSSDEERPRGLTQRERNELVRATNKKEKEIASLRKKLSAVEKEIEKKRQRGAPESTLKSQFREADRIAKELRIVLTGK